MKISLPFLYWLRAYGPAGLYSPRRCRPGLRKPPRSKLHPRNLRQRKRRRLPRFRILLPRLRPQNMYVVPSGTRLPLILHNAVTTRNAKPGDPVYLETLFPVVIDNRILIPAGSYVQGEIQEAKRPGKVKGTGEIRLRLNSMILPNGYAVDFNAVPTNAGTGGNEATDKEGNIHGDTDKADDVGTVVEIDRNRRRRRRDRHAKRQGRGHRSRRRRGGRTRCRAPHARPRTGTAARHDRRRRPRSDSLSRFQPR